MEFLTVGQNKLKIVMDRDEAAEYRVLSLDTEDKGFETGRIVKRILDRAERDSGFKVGEERVLVQVYPTGDGGCELFITRLGALGERERRIISEDSSLITYTRRRAVYRFDTFLSLVNATAALRLRDTPSDLYYYHTGVYYLAISDNLTGALSDTDRLGEWGAREKLLPLGIDGEWGSLLIKDNAIKILSQIK